MTLDELLALLPDNDTGQISAADLRTIVSELWNQGAEVEARVTALEAGATGAGGISVAGRWQINPQAGASPGGMQVTSDTGFVGSSSWLRFAPVDQSNTDLTLALTRCSTVFAQQANDSGNWITYRASAASVESGYVELTVTTEAGEGTVGPASWQAAIFVLGGIA